MTTADNGALTFRFGTDSDERARALKASLRHGRTRRFTRQLGAVGAAPTAGAFLIALARGRTIMDAVGSAFPFALVSLAWLGLFAAVPMQQYARIARRIYGPGGGSELRSVDRAGVSTSSGAGAELLPWHAISEVVETDEFFLLYSAHSAALYIPKRAIPVEAELTLRDLFEKAFEARPEQLRLQ